MGEKTRILIADDHPLFRQGVVHSLASEPDFVVIGEAATSEMTLTKAQDLMPDMVLLDIHMPGAGGLSVASKIATACPATKIVMLTVSEHEDDLLAALKAGACGYVLKGIAARELTNILRQVAAGEVYVTPALAANVLREMSQEPERDPLDQLTARERQILSRVAKGLTNYEIGQQLHLAEKTVKHYMTNILRKLHVRSRVEAALVAYQHHSDK